MHWLQNVRRFYTWGQKTCCCFNSCWKFNYHHHHQIYHHLCRNIFTVPPPVDTNNNVNVEEQAVADPEPEELAPCCGENEELQPAVDWSRVCCADNPVELVEEMKMWWWVGQKAPLLLTMKVMLTDWKNTRHCGQKISVTERRWAAVQKGPVQIETD